MQGKHKNHNLVRFAWLLIGIGALIVILDIIGPSGGCAVGLPIFPINATSTTGSQCASLAVNYNPYNWFLGLGFALIIIGAAIEIVLYYQ